MELQSYSYTDKDKTSMNEHNCLYILLRKDSYKLLVHVYNSKYHKFKANFERPCITMKKVGDRPQGGVGLWISDAVSDVETATSQLFC